ncbi:type IX secretion system plug protein domain-containing protein [Rubrivirga sp. IMCC43871]|uniref:type IX secretion system plug protein domain-containing protein n=1 Tax=Rubrivirga sp. IMCC43871 TaxID=3391575 RepID=UPI00398FB46F
MPSFRALPLAALALLAACVIPEEAYDTAPDTPPARPGELVVADARVGALQLHAVGDEASLPVITLRGRDQLRLEFDLVGEEIGQPLEISFEHASRTGRSELLPSEFLTSFESDRILLYERSTTSATVPYVHYTYDFPNRQIGFKISGNFRAVVSTTAGARLFEIPFYVSEELADVQLAFGSTVQGGSVGFAVQPAARLRPDARLSEFDGSMFTVCFGRNGRTDQLRCAPEPSLVDLALYQFYLPRDRAFAEQEALFELDLGFLGTNSDVLEVDRAARPPTALLDLDYEEFGGDVRQPTLASIPLIETAYRDVGRADTDGQYVATTFQYVPPNSRQSPRRVFVVGPFNGWKPRPDAEMEWVEAQGRYVATLLLKQGRYVYGYDGPTTQTPGLGTPSVFTAFVYLADPQRFTDRLIAVRSAVAR